MQENEFEKKIQEQLDQLRLEPAGEVWKKIEQQLPGEKRRRGAWLMIVGMLLVLGGGAAWWLMEQNDFKQQAAAATNKQPNDSPAQPVPNEATVTQEHSNSTTIVDASNLEGSGKSIKDNRNDAPAAHNNLAAVNAAADQPVRSSIRDQQLIENSNALKKMRASKVFTSTSGNPADLQSPLVNTKRVAKTKRKMTAVVTAAAPDELDMQAGQLQVAANPVNNTIQDNNTAAVNSNVETVTQQAPIPDPAKADAKKVAQHVVTVADSTTKAATLIKNKTKGKWSIAVSLEAGRVLMASKPSNAAYVSDVQNGTTGSIGGVTNSFQPASMKGGWRLAAGVHIARDLSARISIQTGAGYRLFTSSMPVGARMEASVFYSPNRGDSIFGGNSATYTTFYHQLSIPLSVGIQLNRPGSRSVRFNAGADVAWLLASNALQFNYSTGLYYKSNVPLNTTMVGLTASLTVNLAAKGQSPLYIGPECYYALTPMATSGHYGGIHPIFVGIRLQKSIR